MQLEKSWKNWRVKPYDVNILPVRGNCFSIFFLGSIPFWSVFGGVSTYRYNWKYVTTKPNRGRGGYSQKRQHMVKLTVKNVRKMSSFALGIRLPGVGTHLIHLYHHATININCPWYWSSYIHIIVLPMLKSTCNCNEFQII